MVTQTPVPSAPGPVFSAITSSTRHIYLLLRCIGFMPNANVSISGDNIRFTVEDCHSMQANVCLTPDLFSSYKYTPSTLLYPTTPDAPPPSSAERFALESEDNTVRFQISLAALLECLQIFGADSNQTKQYASIGGITSRDNLPTFGRPPNSTNLFDSNSLRLPGTCRIVYEGDGRPLSVILEDAGVTTTCHLTTFISPTSYELIPFERTSMTHKIIIKGAWLHDAFQELDATSPEILTYSVSPHKPYFSLSGNGILSTVTVDFSNNKNVLETFNANTDSSNKYKFSLIKKAMKAMGLATKASLRGDASGVLSMQYLIEMPEKGGAGPIFIDFRFLPLNEEADEDGEDSSYGEGEGDEAEEAGDDDEMML
ncbi:hypothetical protein ABW19_dt0209779 [Dactylella cylindrospora]|nr:hypothetical protein ABW19_dt0209779 [Dactylella cylindrospora]